MQEAATDQAQGGTANIADEVRRATSPGAAYETVAPLAPGLTPQAMLLAFYRPGDPRMGWTELGRAVPRFAGHLQPRLTGELGQYRQDSATLRRQAVLARGAGVEGFVVSFYWFNRRRVFEAPLEAFLADRGINMPFCLIWENEPLGETLIQEYLGADEADLLGEFSRHFADSRYVRLDGRPILFVQRADLIPDTANTLDRWRRLLHDGYGENPVFVMGDCGADPQGFGMDAAVELTPRFGSLQPANPRLTILDSQFAATVYDYAAVIRASVEAPAPPYALIKTALPGWDDDPRHEGKGTVMHGATPELYQAWLQDLVGFARRNPLLGEPIVCINAWNAWADGATLEPDVHWGGAFLNATARAAACLPPPGARTRILLIGEDAGEGEAQDLLLRLGRALRAGHGVDVAFLLLAGGAREAEFREVATVVVAKRQANLDILVRESGCRAAIANTATAMAALERQGVPAVLMIQDWPRGVAGLNQFEPLRRALSTAQSVVFPAEYVRDRCNEAVPLDGGRTTIVLPGVALASQGRAGRTQSRQALGAGPNTAIMLGAGRADLSHGFDLFLQSWRIAHVTDRPVLFLWAGAMDPGVRAALGAELAAAEATGTFRFLGEHPDPASLCAAADVFLLTWRHAAMPAVALRALTEGTPVAAFSDAGGVPEWLTRLNGGTSVPLGDVTAMAAAALRLATAFNPARRSILAASGRRALGFDRTTQRLLALAQPGLLPVSVVVPSFNYGRFMQSRMASIFAQSHPVMEVVVLDDASADDSVAIAEHTAAEWGRCVRIEQAEQTSGSVFAQWRRAAETATSDWLWIAEADDAADPHFLGALADAVGRANDPAMAFCDSRAIDDCGATLWPDHKTYYGAPVLAVDAVFDGAAFLRDHLAHRNVILNASAVLWRRMDLLAALRQCEPELRRLQMAGDWRVYAQVLARPGAQIAYVARPLNHHRRHHWSVMARLPAASHAAEAQLVHQAVANLLGPHHPRPGDAPAAPAQPW